MHDEHAPPAAGLRFVEVTGAAGLADARHVNGARGERLFPETMGGGIAFVDVNGDGWQDLVIAGGGTWDEDNPVAALRIFENAGNGTFVERTEQYGLAHLRGHGMGLAAADYDNDGDTDLFLTTIFQDLLLRNDLNSGGGFQEVGRQAFARGDSTWTTSAIFFDADRDGWVDLFAGGYVPWTPATDLWCMSGGTKSYCTPEVYFGTRSFFYKNRQDGTFQDQTQEAGLLPLTGKVLGVAETDFNEDGWPDLAVAIDTQPDALFENQRDNTFRNVAFELGTAYDDRGRARAGMGIDVGVVDSSGRATVFVGNFSNEMIGVYRRSASGVFEDRAALSRVGGTSRRTLAFGLFLFDADLDGDLDLFVANGHITPEVDAVDDDVTYRQRPHLFLNDGGGLFTDVIPDVGEDLATPMVGRGTAYADYDLDGDLDVAVVENGGPVRLFRNEVRAAGEGPAFLRIELTGTHSNRSALGTRVRAFVGGQMQERRVRSGSSYQSQSELPITFGFGQHVQVDSVEVVWPSGSRVVIHRVPVNQVLRWTEEDVPVSQAIFKQSR